MTADVASRIARVQSAMAEAGVSGLVVTPGSDLRYLTGYDAIPLERLTALVVPLEGEPSLVVPLLEEAEAQKSPAALAGMQVVTHGDGVDVELVDDDPAGAECDHSLFAHTDDVDARELVLAEFAREHLARPRVDERRGFQRGNRVEILVAARPFDHQRRIHHPTPLLLS